MEDVVDCGKERAEEENIEEKSEREWSCTMSGKKAGQTRRLRAANNAQIWWDEVS